MRLERILLRSLLCLWRSCSYRRSSGTGCFRTNSGTACCCCRCSLCCCRVGSGALTIQEFVIFFVAWVSGIMLDGPGGTLSDQLAGFDLHDVLHIRQLRCASTSGSLVLALIVFLSSFLRHRIGLMSSIDSIASAGQKSGCRAMRC